MAEEATTTGDSATPPVAATPVATPPVETPPATPPTTPSGSEPENNTGDDAPATVPSDRLREETEKRRKVEEENERLQQELDASKQTTTTQDDVELEPDTEKLLDSYVKKHGFVSQKELEAERLNIQVQQDIKELTSTPPDTGIPFNYKDVMDFAKDNNLPITSRAALQAAYRELNHDKIVEAERQRAIDGYKKAGSSGAEQPGSSGATEPSEPEIDPKISGKERTRERIRLAKQKLNL